MFAYLFCKFGIKVYIMISNKKVVCFLLILSVIYSCAKNPFTGKSTLALVPNSEILPSAFQQYSQFLTENKVITGTSEAKNVEVVGKR